jgi:phosphoglycerol transferase MdoB-like AlkP superfamily enzyme
LSKWWLFWNQGEMKKETKKIIKLMINSMLVVSIILLSITFCLISARIGFGLKLDPPFCWASFLQVSLLMLSGWAFNKELFYY